MVRVNLGDGNVEVRPQSVFDAAYHLTFVFEGLRAFNANLEREIPDHPCLVLNVQRTAFSHREMVFGGQLVLFLNEGFRRYALGNEILDDVPNLDVAVVRDRNTAFHAVPHFADIFLEAPHRGDLAPEDDHVVP